ncbi:MAG TPA: hypothetical protein VFB32_00635 [Rudaea sp.]|nr:hypothetical protein [Rudaea sp.]
MSGHGDRRRRIEAERVVVRRKRRRLRAAVEDLDLRIGARGTRAHAIAACGRGLEAQPRLAAAAARFGERERYGQGCRKPQCCRAAAAMARRDDFAIERPARHARNGASRVPGRGLEFREQQADCAELLLERGIARGGRTHRVEPAAQRGDIRGGRRMTGFCMVDGCADIAAELLQVADRS